MHGHVSPIWRNAALETARRNATIRKDSKFVFDFASQNIKIDAVVTEVPNFGAFLLSVCEYPGTSGWATRG